MRVINGGEISSIRHVSHGYQSFLPIDIPGRATASSFNPFLATIIARARTDVNDAGLHCSFNTNRHNIHILSCLYVQMHDPGHKFRAEHAQHPPSSFRLECLRSASVVEVRY